MGPKRQEPEEQPDVSTPGIPLVRPLREDAKLFHAVSMAIYGNKGTAGILDIVDEHLAASRGIPGLDPVTLEAAAQVLGQLRFGAPTWRLAADVVRGLATAPLGETKGGE